MSKKQDTLWTAFGRQQQQQPPPSAKREKLQIVKETSVARKKQRDPLDSDDAEEADDDRLGCKKRRGDPNDGRDAAEVLVHVETVMKQAVVVEEDVDSDPLELPTREKDDNPVKLNKRKEVGNTRYKHVGKGVDRGSDMMLL